MIKISNTHKSKEVVVILPYVNNKVLLQLRDIKEDISFPGCWGFFGGSIDDGETPDDASARELFEEIGYQPPIMHKLGFEIIPDLGNLTLHAYCCPLRIPIQEIKLMEGLDLDLFSLEEIMAKVLYSRKMGGLFPIIGKPHFIDTIRKLLHHLEIA
jgi:8-oxo-dGTP pyrophosphatase MutT (NUDIX family)